jgi:hypothetical protein
LINAAETPDPIKASGRIVKFIEENEIQVLNVAGPRLSGWAAGYRFALDVIGGVIATSNAKAFRQSDFRGDERSG